MGYLDNTTILIDAILTNKGRELLSKGTQSFKITKFALSDDEIDYKLWNPNHNLGSDYYGEAIENLPILEASSNETQVMKYKLVTLAAGVTQMSVMVVGPKSVELGSAQTYIVAPSITNNPTANSVYGYTAILSPTSTRISMRVSPGYELTNTFTYQGTDDEASGNGQSVVLSGKRFELKTSSNLVGTAIFTLTIIANETGNSETIVINTIGTTITEEA